MPLGIVIIYSLAFSVMSAILANSKKRDPWGWGALGLVFGIFAFLLLWSLPAGEKTIADKSLEEMNKTLDKRAIIFAIVLFGFIFLLTEFGG